MRPRASPSAPLATAALSSATNRQPALNIHARAGPTGAGVRLLDRASLHDGATGRNSWPAGSQAKRVSVPAKDLNARTLKIVVTHCKCRFTTCGITLAIGVPNPRSMRRIDRSTINTRCKRSSRGSGRCCNRDNPTLRSDLARDQRTGDRLFWRPTGPDSPKHDPPEPPGGHHAANRGMDQFSMPAHDRRCSRLVCRSRRLPPATLNQQEWTLIRRRAVFRPTQP